MNYASNAQLQKIHFLLNRLGWMDDKKQLISNATDGRTDSSKLLYFEEARQLIRNLAEYDPAERLKSLIFVCAYRSGIIYGATGEDKKINAAKLNLFLKQRGAIKKALNDMSYPELVKTYRQFEAIAQNVTCNKADKEAGNAVRHLLDEMNLTTIAR